MPIVFNQIPRKSNQELELRFLRHLAYRASHENGKYLSERDKVALARLASAHCQDTSTTSVEDLAVEEYKELNPKAGKAPEMTINITRKQAEDMITLIERNTPISKGVVINFLQSRLNEHPANRVHREDGEFLNRMFKHPDFCNSDLV